MIPDIDAITDGYITAALWADCTGLCTCGDLYPDATGDGHAHHCPSIEPGNLQHLDVSADDRAYIRRMIELFVFQAGADLLTFAKLHAFDPSQGTVWHHIGHDLRLTASGHGTGFWDREPDADMREQSNASDLAKFGAARHRLSQLAYPDDSHLGNLYSRIGGGDCWQESDTMAAFDHLNDADIRIMLRHVPATSIVEK